MREQLVEQVARQADACMHEQPHARQGGAARAGGASREDVVAVAAHSMGAALAQLWSQQPSLEALHLNLLRGHILPPPLRAHVWSRSLGGDLHSQHIGTRLARQMDKEGIKGPEALDASGHAVAVKRTAQELFSARAALQTDGLSSPATLNIAARVLLRLIVLSGTQSDAGAAAAEGAPASTRRLQRALLLLAPLLFVFEPERDKEVLERHLVGWLAKLVAVDEALPSLSALPPLALDIARQVRAADGRLASAIAGSYFKSHHAGGEGDEGEDDGLALLLQGWLSSGLSGYLSMRALLLSWDQCFIEGWHLLGPACVRLVLKLRSELLRAADKGWQECLAVMASAPLRLSPAAVRACFASDGAGVGDGSASAAASLLAR
eukprot:Tamp_09627.p1 GENE.Tamp_09627~~Tamp_09627.p1  ORF type:complete len:379 (-),score=78.08 Tamp_09627:365-1501(-)